jgi:hypothetical protein
MPHVPGASPGISTAPTSARWDLDFRKVMVNAI